MRASHYFLRQMRRDALIQFRQPGMIINSSLFFIMIMVFFPLTMPPDARLLLQIAPGLVWIATLLSMLLASERLFQQDYDTGVIEQWLVSGNSLAVLLAARLLVQWLLTIIPLLLFCPLLALLFGLSMYQVGILALSLIAGTPCLLGLCALAAAFGTGMQQKGVFMALILLPLAVPVMIFGSGTVVAAINQEPVSGHLALISAVSLLTICFLPFAIAALIRISLAE
ncbi:heme exporter protein CcmB [Legionella sp. CNM-4043-24]|uniref:heme exporter protein CcmB n=1 Tax=Legionella sp. CNM-4043-24 TaxID=3421646 RepID=UPI00403AA0C8